MEDWGSLFEEGKSLLRQMEAMHIKQLHSGFVVNLLRFNIFYALLFILPIIP